MNYAPGVPMRESDIPRTPTSYAGETIEDCQPPKKPVDIHFDILRGRVETLEHLVTVIEETFNCVLTQPLSVLEPPADTENTKSDSSSNSLLVEWLMAVCYSLDCSITRLNRLLERSDVG